MGGTGVETPHKMRSDPDQIVEDDDEISQRNVALHLSGIMR